MSVQPIGDSAGNNNYLAAGMMAPTAQTTPVGNSQGPAGTPTVNSGANLSAVRGLNDRDYLYNGIVGNTGANDPSNATPASGTAGTSDNGQTPSDDELKKMFGQNADRIKKLLAAHPDLDVGTLKDLQAKGGLDDVLKALEDHPGWHADDVITKDPNGNVRANPILKDQSAMHLLNARSDIKPADLAAMQQSIETAVGKDAAPQFMHKAEDLLAKRTDITPDQVGKMVGDLAGATKDGSGKANVAAASDMMDKACDLLEKRSDISPDDMGKLAKDAGKTFGDPQSQNSGQDVAQGFGMVCDMLKNNKNMNVAGADDVMKTLQEHFKDPGQRLTAMSNISKMGASGANVDAGSIDSTLRNLEKQGKQGNSLLSAFGKSTSDVASGRQTMQGMVQASDPASANRPGQQQDGQHRDPNNPNGQNQGQDAGNPFTGAPGGPNTDGTGGRRDHRDGAPVSPDGAGASVAGTGGGPQGH